MTKLLKYLMFILVAIAVASCSDDDGPDGDGSSGKVSSQTEAMIKQTFPGMRLDSIARLNPRQEMCLVTSTKLSYNGNLLSSYIVRLDDGGSFDLKYSKDTVYVNDGAYKGILGANGLIEKLICRSGKINEFVYDSENRLIRYNPEVADPEDTRYTDLEWQDGNIVKTISHYPKTDNYGNIISDLERGVRTKVFTYGTDLNSAGLQIPGYEWIDDIGYSMGYGVYQALYYAGLFGPVSKNLPVSRLDITGSEGFDGRVHYTLYYNYVYDYEFDSEGYVKSVKIQEFIKDSREDKEEGPFGSPFGIVDTYEFFYK